jgi:hypothetical protein
VLSPQDLCGALVDDDAGSHGVAGGHAWHDGPIRDAKVFDPIDLKPGNNTLISGFSARRRATTDPEEPEPQTMKSYCDFRLDLSVRWFTRTRSPKSSIDL